MLPQTTIVEGRTHISACVSRGSPFQGCEYRIWATKTLKRASPGNACWNVGSAFHNRRLGGLITIRPRRANVRQTFSLGMVFVTGIESSSSWCFDCMPVWWLLQIPFYALQMKIWGTFRKNPLQWQHHCVSSTDTSSCYHHLVNRVSSSLCSPNEDFGRRNKIWNPDFRLTFQWLVAQIEYSRPWKVLRTSGFHLLFHLPKSSFGRDKVTVQLSWTGTSACYHHLVCWTDTSTSCEFDGHIGMLSSCDSCDVWQTHRHAIIILWVVWVRLTNRSLIRSLIRLARTLKHDSHARHFTPPKRRFGREEQKM